jgi:uncharacterized protein DUF4836
MHKRILPVLFMATILVFLASCGSKKQAGITQMIPADASNVLAINIDRIGQKMDFNTLAKENEESFSKIRMFVALMGIPDFLEDRDVLGVDFESPVYVYYDFNRKEGLGFNVLLRLEDEDRFEAFLQKLKPTEKTEENGISGISLNIGQVYWKDGIAWISMGDGNLGKNSNPFLITPEKSIASTAFGEKIASTDVSDFAMWTNPMSTVPKLKELAPDLKPENFLDYIATMTLNFENGQIACDYTINTQGETTRNFDKFVGKGINPDLLTGLDKSEIPGILSFSINPEMIQSIFLSSGIEKAILQYEGDEEEINEEEVQKVKTVINIMAKALRGDVVIALKGFEKKNDTSSMQPDIYIAAGIQDRKPIDSLLNKWISDTMLIEKEGYYETAENKKTKYIIVEESRFYIVNSVDARNALLNNESQSQISEGLTNKLTGMPSYLSVDFNLLQATLNDFMKDQSMGSMGMLSSGLMSVLSAFDQLEMTSVKKSPDVYSASFVLTMKDKEQNSMAFIFKKMMDLTSSIGR